MRKVLSFLYFFICASLLFSVTALAYIDPSAMTYVIQIIAGVAIAAGAAFGFYFRKLKRKFSRFGKKKDHAVSYGDDMDDDDTGFGDYEIEGFAGPSSETAASFAGTAPETVPLAGETARAAAFSTVVREPDLAFRTARTDPYDESGGEGGLLAENRELRRLLAEERRNVEELKRALHICTAPKR